MIGMSAMLCVPVLIGFDQLAHINLPHEPGVPRLVFNTCVDREVTTQHHGAISSCNINRCNDAEVQWWDSQLSLHTAVIVSVASDRCCGCCHFVL